jgi:hypothetical protein
MKKYSLIFKLSFISYFFVHSGIDPFAEWWRWVWLVIPFSYQMFYVFFLRKKEFVSFSRSIANSFLYYSFIVVLLVIRFYVYIFFNGYTVSRIGFSRQVSQFYGVRETHYGFEAWRNVGSGFFNFDSMILPMVIPCVIYWLFYFIINKKIREDKRIA